MRALIISGLARKRESLLTHLCSRLGALRLESSLAEAENPLSKLSEGYLTETRARIFGYRIGDGNRSGAKLLKKKLVLDKIKNYYPKSPEDSDPFFEHPRIEK